MRHWVLVVLVFIRAFGVSADEAAHSRIFDGTNAPIETYPFVARVLAPDVGSGTLIAPGFVLTAAHLVGATQPASQISVEINHRTYAVSAFYIHPSFIKQGKEGSHDSCLLKLASPVLDVTPIPILRTAPVVGQSGTIFGFGFQGDGATAANGVYPAVGTVNAAPMTIEQITPTFLSWTFKSGMGGLGNGDSGGPLLMNVAGLNYVAATASSVEGGSAYGGVEFESRVDVVADWIDSIVGGAPSAPPPSGVNSPPAILSGPTADKTVAFVGTDIAFSVTASDPNGDAISISWDFGDGTSGVGAALTHSFNSPGTFQVAVTVADNGSTRVSASLPVQILPLQQIGALKSTFALNFHNAGRDSIDLSMWADTLRYDSTAAFLAATNGTTVEIVLGDPLAPVPRILDSVTVGSGGTAHGVFTWNYRTGVIRYRASKLDLASWFAAIGATNETTKGTQISLPVYFKIGENYFGTTYTLTYTARAGQSGRGASK